MNSDEKYLFDINGYIIVRNVLSDEEIARCNEAIDHHSHLIRERTGEQSLSGESKTLKGITGRGDLGGVLSWEKPWRDPFREMIAHPRIVPYLNVILGAGFRMDHNCGLVTMREGAEGHTFHGSSGPGFDPNQYYIFKKWPDAQRFDRGGLAILRRQRRRWRPLSDPGKPQGQLSLSAGDEVL